MTRYTVGRIVDLVAHESSSGIGGTSAIAFVRHKGPPTVCGHPDRDDADYYCIRASKHPGRHRYGKVIEGTFRVR